MTRKVTLSCDVCASRNYSVPARKDKPTERLTLKKYCRHCDGHTIHRQTA